MAEDGGDQHREVMGRAQPLSPCALWVFTLPRVVFTSELLLPGPRVVPSLVLGRDRSFPFFFFFLFSYLLFFFSVLHLCDFSFGAEVCS